MCLIIAVQQIAIMKIVQLPIVVSDPAFLLLIHLQQTFPSTSFWLSSRRRSSFRSKLSITLWISWLRQGSLCFINFFLPRDGRTSAVSLSLERSWSVATSSVTDSSDDMNSAFNTGLIFSLVPSSKVLDRFNTLKRARAFCKIYIKYLNTILFLLTLCLLWCFWDIAAFASCLPASFLLYKLFLDLKWTQVAPVYDND